MPKIKVIALGLMCFVWTGVLAASASADTFPEVDKSKLKITLQRTACLGSCPAYRVTIFGNGRVVFEGATNRSGVSLGNHEDHIDPQVVDALIAQFKRANFFELNETYRASITDNPFYFLTFDTGASKKTVEDYVGKAADMPPAVSDLENAVDAAAETDRWVKGHQALR